MKDIREYKKNLRQRYRDYRTRLQPQVKSRLDEDILSRVTRLNQYANTDLLLVYVSTPIEVDTRRLIEVALADGKRVAVPRCVPDTRLMEFYEITSLDQLSPGTFGVLEPDPDTATRLPEDPGGMCIVPALCYDEYGYRLGYGKGYYDRFLSGYSGITVGICYAACVRGSLVYGRYDRPVELLVTERYIKRTVPPTEKVRIKNNWGRNRNG
jgi:5-formyltetrahydrofolate cyclo-ligase